MIELKPIWRQVTDMELLSLATAELGRFQTPRYGDVYYTSYDEAIATITQAIEEFVKLQFLHPDAEINEELVANDGICSLATMALLGRYGVTQSGTLLEVGPKSEHAIFAYADDLERAGFIFDIDNKTATPPPHNTP